MRRRRQPQPCRLLCSRRPASFGLICRIGCMSDTRLREQLARALDWDEAHVGLDKAVEGVPADKRGARPAGFDHSAWQLLEHMRIAQEDILDFCVNAKYVHSR